MNKLYALIIILFASLPVSESMAQVYVPSDYSNPPLERTSFQKGISTASDITALALPVATLAGVLIAKDWEGLKEAALTAVVAGGATYILKLSVREQRPDHSNYKSFPSFLIWLVFTGFILLSSIVIIICVLFFNMLSFVYY